jgi:WD40 repeat protein/tRNA A-37 threonylcarbamoyl transferase component Bud32
MFHNDTFGDYQLLEMVARGGMGIVFKAHEKKLERIVALKMILAGQLASEQDISRFHAEAQAAARLDHPSIVPVYEVGQQNGLHYFTMAFIEGKSLAESLHDGPLAPQLAAHLIRELAVAVEYAHQQGIVHRDLKPANVLIDAQGRPKLTDFGLAKRIQDTRNMTGTGQILGTPTYMSPEQAEGDSRHIGPASDIYGLGALLFALLTGRPPFQAATPLETMRHVLSMEPPRPRALNPSVPRDLETICLKCLEKSPGKRYATAAALADDIDRYLNDRPIQARPAGTIEKAFRWYRRRPVIGTMATVLALLLVAVPVLLAGLWQEADARAQVEAAGHQEEAAARRKIEALERERTRQLFQAYVNEAAARRTSPRVGRHFDAIDRIMAARALADELKLPSEDYVSLRSEAISALSLADLRGTTTGPGWAIRDYTDPTLFRPATGADCYLDWDKPSGLFVRRIGNNSIVQRIPDLRLDHDTPELSPDNRFVAVVSDGKLVVWQVDGATPKVIARHDKLQYFTFAPDRPEIVLLTPQREIVILSLDGKLAPKTLRIPEIQKEPMLRHWQHLASAGRRLAVAGPNRVSIVDLDAGKVTSVCNVSDPVNTMAWSPDGATLAVGFSEGDFIFYEPASQHARLAEGPRGGALSVNFDPTGRYLLSRSGWGGRGILWDVANASPVVRFNNAELATKGTAYAGPRLAAWWQGALNPPHRFMTSLLPNGHIPRRLRDSAIHPGGRLLATQTPDGILLSDLVLARRISFLPTVNGTNLRFDSAGNLYGYINNQPHRWPITREGNRFQIGQPERLNLPQFYTCLGISPDGRLVAQPTPGGAILLDRESGKTTLLQPQQDVRGVAVHPNGSLVASFGWSTPGFRLWETKSGKLIHAHNEGYGRGGQFTPDGKHLITADWCGDPGAPAMLSLWSVPDCKLVRKLGSSAGFAISPDSRCIAAAESGGKVRLNRIDNGEMIARFDAPGDDYLADIYFSPDGRYLLGANLDQNKHHVWDLWELRRQLRELKLDWETTPVPVADAKPTPITVEIVEAAAKTPTKNP